MSYTITGTSGSFRDSETGRPMEQGGPLGTRVLVDGREVTGTDGGLVECDPGGTPEAYDIELGPQQVQVPEGEHTLSVEVEYCGPDGEVLTATDATTAYWPGQGSVADRAAEDLDGDGTRERLVLVDEGDRSALLVQGGSVTGRVELGAMVPGWISGADDLDGDGTTEVLVDVDLGELVQTVVVTLDRRGDPTLGGAAGGPPQLLNGVADGRFHGSMLINGVITSWSGEGDGEQVGPVEGGMWVLDGTTLRQVPFEQETCGSLGLSPRPC